CAWAAEDASGYWADLSPPENAIMGAFTWGPVRERSVMAPAPVATPETVGPAAPRSEEHTSELQSHLNLVCRLLLEKKKNINIRLASIFETLVNIILIAYQRIFVSSIAYVYNE